MPVVLRPNGTPGHMETPAWVNWLMGVLSALLVTGVCASIANYAQVQSLSKSFERKEEADKFLHRDLEVRVRDLEQNKHSHKETN